MVRILEIDGIQYNIDDNYVVLAVLLEKVLKQLERLTNKWQ